MMRFALQLLCVVGGMCASLYAETIELRNDHLVAKCDPGTGRFDLSTAAGEAVIRSFTAAVNDALVSDSRFSRSVEKRDDSLGLICRDSQRQFELEHRIALLPDRAGVVMELMIRNASDKDVIVPFAQPLRALLDEKSGCEFVADKVLTNGYIYYDPGQLVEFTPQRTPEIDSYWNAAFYREQPRQALVVGFLNNDQAEGHVRAGRSRHTLLSANGGFNLVADSHFHKAFVLKPHATVSTGKLLLLLSPDPHEALEFYSDRINLLHKVHLNPIINGWCTWFVYYGNATENDVLDHAKFVARELKPYGMDWIQIDDGYQTAFGNWEGNKRFSHGMKWLADQIRAEGLKPGLWIAPFAISANTEVAQKHPEWLVHDAKGEIQKIVKEHQAQAQYILDITHPGAQKWLEELIHTITHEWGYDFIKTDFVEWTILAAERFGDPTVTKAGAYRLGNEIMRRAMGPERHLLDCGPGLEIVGLLDSMRIGLDRPDDAPGFQPFNQYAGFYNSAIGAMSKRYYFHNKTWINDPDHLRLAKLSIAQAQSAATIIAMSGGTMISGDNLPKLDRERLEILKKVLPAYGHAARPLDLFERPQAELFALPIESGFEKYLAVADFNTHSTRQTRRLDFEQLGLNSKKSYLVHEFWTQRLIGEATEGITFNSDPYTVNLFALREKRSAPQILGTDRHVTQGAVELKDVEWDASSNAMTGTALGGSGRSWTIAVHVPKDFEPNLKNAQNLTDLAWSAPVLRAKVPFNHNPLQPWKLQFKKL